MANKLIQDLTAGNILVTDLLEHQPIAGPPSLRGTVTQLFSDAAGALAIDRDNRQLRDGANAINFDWNQYTLISDLGGTCIDWSQRLLIDSSATNSIDWENRLLIDSGGSSSVDWENRKLFDAGGVIEAVDWFSRQLINSAQQIIVDWENGIGIINAAFIDQANRFLLDSSINVSLNWESRLLLDGSGNNTLDWENRQLIGSDGTTVILDWNTLTPIDTTQRVFSTPTDPNGVVTATKPAMCYGDDGSLWVKTTAGPDNTGWTALITA